MEDNERVPEVRRERVNNLGFWPVEDQLTIERACVAVAGLGGAGGLVVELLGRCGVSNWQLADPDVSEVENLGRQAGSAYETVGLSKVDCAQISLRRVNRNTVVTGFKEGITAENVVEFIADADVVLDAVGIETAWVSVLLGREAARRQIPMVTSIEVGDGCQYTAFRPNPVSELDTVDAFFGVDADSPADEQMDIDVDALLSFVPPSFPQGLLEAAKDGLVSTPAISMGVARNASAVARAIRLLILDARQDHPFYYPNVIVDDPDPEVGTFCVHHRDRQALLRDSLAATLSQSPPHRFSSVGSYKVV